jgi:hypothetical protein
MYFNYSKSMKPLFKPKLVINFVDSNMTVLESLLFLNSKRICLVVGLSQSLLPETHKKVMAKSNGTLELCLKWFVPFSLIQIFHCFYGLFFLQRQTFLIIGPLIPVLDLLLHTKFFEVVNLLVSITMPGVFMCPVLVKLLLA